MHIHIIIYTIFEYYNTYIHSIIKYNHLASNNILLQINLKYTDYNFNCLVSHHLLFEK